MEKTLEKLTELEKRLDTAIQFEDLNEGISIVYYLRGHTSLLSSEVSQSVDKLLSQFDASLETAKIEGYSTSAVLNMRRLHGLVKGLIDETLYGSKHIPSQAANIGVEVPTFTLPQKEKERVLELCSAMRRIVLAAEAFDQPHKRLLLNRISAIEYQVEQPKGIFDIVRAGVSDVGETLGKFGADIKPLTDRMKEVVKITRRNSNEYDQIPAPEEVKQITDQSDGETGESE